MENLIEVKNLSKVFNSKGKGKIKALKNISFSVKKGEIFALLGSNGAGKTTTLRIITTLMKPTDGKVIVAGYNVKDDARLAKEQIGFLTAEMNLYDYFTVREILKFFGRINGLDKSQIEKRISCLVNLLELQDYLDRRVDNFSTGMKQKVSIARALMADPQIIIFDEPINGLDLMAARVVTNLIKKLKKEGKSIILSTHNMNLAENLSDRIGIIFKGSLKAVDTLDELSKLHDKDNLEDIFFELVGETDGLE